MSGFELDLFGLPAPVEVVREEVVAIEESEVVALEPGQHVERALAGELEPEETVTVIEDHGDYQIVDEVPATVEPGGQEALFDLGGLTHDPLAEVRAQWNATEATTPEARLAVFRSVTVKAMKLAYALADYEAVIKRFERVCKALGVRNPSEAVPLLLDYYEKGPRHAHRASNPVPAPAGGEAGPEPPALAPERAGDEPGGGAEHDPAPEQTGGGGVLVPAEPAGDRGDGGRDSGPPHDGSSERDGANVGAVREGPEVQAPAAGAGPGVGSPAPDPEGEASRGVRRARSLLGVDRPPHKAKVTEWVTDGGGIQLGCWCGRFLLASTSARDADAAILKHNETGEWP